ncbi:MBL fold metallo-hydrolase [Microvirga flavescens]|uniref:MBL fold metallo-hydrolase n=1 Tax=Microvirga flavescens TaxID=2249811 RepID=UPI000DD82446|nr:MBL fold metallo-hydrolase [Microvirga flavescens]
MSLLRVRILGCGSSGGVPRVASGWGACDPANPRNRRRRCSVLVEQTNGSGATSVLVDTSPDLREQLLDAGVTQLDSVLFTHQHADHTHGIDDLRPLVIAMRQRIPVYADRVTSDLLFARFGYCFDAPPGSSYPPILEAHLLKPGEPIRIQGAGEPLEALPFQVVHGDIDALGFRFGKIGYVPDVSFVPEDCIPYLEGLEVLIIDALRFTPHPTHFSVADALAFIERVKPQRAVLTNLHSDLDYETLRRQLPSNVEPAFDGMVVEAR